MGQEERSDLKDLHPGSPSLMMSYTRFSEPSSTTGFVGTTPPVIEIPPSPTPPSNEEVDTSGDDWNLGDESAPFDTSKFSHLIIEEGEITSLP